MMTTLTIKRKKILCPVDFSLASEGAMNYAAEQHARNSELIVLHVAKSGKGKSGTLLKEYLHEFSRYSDILSTHGCLVRFAVEYGQPGAVITAYAQEHRVDMIVIGSHGTSSIPQLLVGSTTETVMRHAPCPVLVMKNPEKEPACTNHAYAGNTVLSNTNE